MGSLLPLSAFLLYFTYGRYMCVLARSYLFCNTTLSGIALHSFYWWLTTCTFELTRAFCRQSSFASHEFLAFWDRAEIWRMWFSRMSWSEARVRGTGWCFRSLTVQQQALDSLNFWSLTSIDLPCCLEYWNCLAYRGSSGLLWFLSGVCCLNPLCMFGQFPESKTEFADTSPSRFSISLKPSIFRCMSLILSSTAVDFFLLTDRLQSFWAPDCVFSIKVWKYVSYVDFW